jgi:hypothetical protein
MTLANPQATAPIAPLLKSKARIQKTIANHIDATDSMTNRRRARRVVLVKK